MRENHTRGFANPAVVVVGFKEFLDLGSIWYISLNILKLISVNLFNIHTVRVTIEENFTEKLIMVSSSETCVQGVGKIQIGHTDHQCLTTLPPKRGMPRAAGQPERLAAVRNMRACCFQWLTTWADRLLESQNSSK